MTTWSELQAHMRRTYKLQTDEGDAMSMTWSYTDGRVQRVVVRRYEAGDLEMVELKSPFAELGGPDPLELLRENARLPVGAAGLSGDVYLLIHNVTLADLTTARLDDLLARVARYADRLVSRFGNKDVF